MPQTIPVGFVKGQGKRNLTGKGSTINASIYLKNLLK